MARLAEYLRRLANVFGNEDHIHFLRVEDGSHASVIEIDEEIEPVVIARTRDAAIGRGPDEAVAGYEALQESLEENGFTAELEQEDGEIVAAFAIPAEADVETFGPFWQEGTIDGLLTRIEGVDETIHVTLIFEGSRCKAEANRELGVHLGPRFYKLVRLFGRGKWFRNAEGRWELQRFVIHSFEDLEDVSLPEIVERLRAIPDNDLKTLADPISEILKIRRGEE
jgi:hypothetical protein